MKQRFILITVLFLIISLNSFCLLHYYTEPSRNKISISDYTIKNLQSGDVILRRSKGIISRWYASMSPHDPYYSHAGFILKSGKNISVVSCTQDHSPAGVISEDFAVFTSPSIAESYTILHYPMKSEAQQKLSEQLQEDIHAQIPFDDAYELAQTENFYCTEYIYQRLLQFAPEVSIGISKSGSWKYIAPENLYLNGVAAVIYTNRNTR